MSHIQTLIAQKTALEAEIDRVQRESRAEGLAAVHTLMTQYGLKPTDLVAKRSAGVVPPKYRHPATGATWTGRGLHPRWVREALATGVHLDHFLIR
jgi:DNA-binding protein H-NS